MEMKETEQKKGRGHKLVQYPGNMNLQPQTKAVQGVDENGNVIYEFDSVADATKKMGLKNRSSITKAIKSGRRAAGCFWRYTDETQNRIHKILQYDAENQLVGTYNSFASAARAVGLSYGYMIKKACTGESKSAGGYFWKFSDELAEKVERDCTFRTMSNCMRAVVAIHPLTGEVLKEFETEAEAARYFGKENSVCISSVCNGRISSYLGLFWVPIAKLQHTQFRAMYINVFNFKENKDLGTCKSFKELADLIGVDLNEEFDIFQFAKEVSEAVNNILKMPDYLKYYKLTFIEAGIIDYSDYVPIYKDQLEYQKKRFGIGL